MTELKSLRIKNNVTQEYCAKLLNISLRSFKDYENNEHKSNSIKYKYILEQLTKHFEVNETKGILSKEMIISTCNEIFKNYKIDYCYLFGSYAKNTATDKSDIDLLISGDIKGLKFYEILEKLRETLHKNIDLLDLNQLNNNPILLNEILKTGEKIYG